MKQDVPATVGRSRHPWLCRSTAAAVVLATGAVALGGCGGGDDGDQTAAPDDTPPEAAESGLPEPSGRSMRALLENMRVGPKLVPGVTLLEPGRNRFGFALFDRSDRQIAGLTVGLYVARGLDEPARGPFVAHFEPIDVKPEFRSKTSSRKSDRARSVYVSKPTFSGSGSYLVAAIVELGGKFVATSPAEVTVGGRGAVPSVGDRAVPVHTLTGTSTGGDVERIETRVPPDTMHSVDLIDALEEQRPVLLVFSSPAHCRGRVCGPAVDVAEQVKAEYGDRVVFIHAEVFGGRGIGGGMRRQARAWKLESEPFAFAIDSNGRVVARLEGAFSVRELEAAVRKALR